MENSELERKARKIRALSYFESLFELMIKYEKETLEFDDKICYDTITMLEFDKKWMEKECHKEAIKDLYDHLTKALDGNNNEIKSFQEMSNDEINKMFGVD